MGNAGKYVTVSFLSPAPVLQSVWLLFLISYLSSVLGLNLIETTKKQRWCVGLVEVDFKTNGSVKDPLCKICPVF